MFTAVPPGIHKERQTSRTPFLHLWNKQRGIVLHCWNKWWCAAPRVMVQVTRVSRTHLSFKISTGSLQDRLCKAQFFNKSAYSTDLKAIFSAQCIECTSDKACLKRFRALFACLPWRESSGIVTSDRSKMHSPGSTKAIHLKTGPTICTKNKLKAILKSAAALQTALHC